jgi:hypothetical protein
VISSSGPFRSVADACHHPGQQLVALTGLVPLACQALCGVSRNLNVKKTNIRVCLRAVAAGTGHSR